MFLLDRVEIRYFRSIYHLKLRQLSDVTVLAGRNDTGKSNILKALNLFFNNQTDWQTPFDFNRDFSRRRLHEVRRETVKGKQFVQVELRFVRGHRYQQSLPRTVTVKKTWHRDSGTPSQTSSIERDFRQKRVSTEDIGRAQAGLQRFLGTFRYEYVPAIKDARLFSYILGRLQDMLLGSHAGHSDLGKAIAALNQSVRTSAANLQSEFKHVTGIDTDIHLPEELGQLFRAFAVATQNGDDQLPLDVRGDGIRTRFIPSLLSYVSANSGRFFIWGFEEPENSLEMAMATSLANTICSEYSHHAQILLTSHSPAFFGLDGNNVTVQRIHTNKGYTEGFTVRHAGKAHQDAVGELENELGLMAFQQELHREFQEKLAKLREEQLAAQQLRDELDKSNKPILLTEGKWDVSILETAWKTLYPKRKRPFRIISCDPDPQGAGGGAGGVTTLVRCLDSHRPDEPPVVGLFDHDREGMKKGFDKLSKNFKIFDKRKHAKVQKSGAAGALVVPVVPGRKKYAEALNLPIEFLFPDGALAKKVGRSQLKLEFPEIEQTVVGTGVSAGRVKATEDRLRVVIDSTKQAFAEKVVPTMSKTDFAGFDTLFKLIEKMFARLAKLRGE